MNVLGRRKGLCKEKKNPEITMEVGGWVEVSHGIVLENVTKIALNQYCYFGVVYHMYSVCICIDKKFWLL